MISKVEMFTVICDNCKKDQGSESEYSCWNDKGAALDEAFEADWIEEDGKHYCRECYKIDDDDNVVINIERFNKYKI